MLNVDLFQTSRRLGPFGSFPPPTQSFISLVILAPPRKFISLSAGNWLRSAGLTFWYLCTMEASPRPPELFPTFFPKSSLPLPLSSVWFWSSFLFLLHTFHQIISKRQRMTGRALFAVAAFVSAFVGTASSQSSTATSFRSIFTVPASADASVPLIPNINDPQALSAQEVCPGYKASNVKRTPYGLTADLGLAGTACNVYGTDIGSLSLTGSVLSRPFAHSFRS